MGIPNSDARNQNKGQPAPETRINSRSTQTKTSKTLPNTTITDEMNNTITLVETNQDANEDGKENQQTERNGNNNVAQKGRKRIRKNKEITIATIIVRGLKGKIRSLESHLQTKKITMVLITETMLKKGDQISIKGYRWIDKPRENNKGGRVGILVSEKIAQNTIEDNSSDEYENLETKWIQIESRPRALAIGVSKDPRKRLHSESERNIRSPIQPTNTQSRKQWNHSSRRFRCKNSNIQNKLQTKRIKKRQLNYSKKSLRTITWQ